MTRAGWSTMAETKTGASGRLRATVRENRTVEIANLTAVKRVREPFMSHSERMTRFARISAALALQSDQQLTRLVNEAEQLATGIGGTRRCHRQRHDLSGARALESFRVAGQQKAAGPEAMESACAIVEHGLTVDVLSMNALGLLHGDAHHGNILTDGHRLYFADLGLATSARFQLSDDEQSYLQHNASLACAYVRAKWVNWLDATKTAAAAPTGTPADPPRSTSSAPMRC
jgi:hypothetical protein